MVGAYLRDKPKRWERILDKLRAADLEQHKISKQLLPGYQYELFRAIQVSVEALEEIGELSAEDVRDRYFDFAVFPEDTPIPEAVLETFWAHLGMDEDDIIDVLDELVDKSLLRRDDREQLTLHDLQYDYIRKRVEDSLPNLNYQLVEAYAAFCNEDWSSGPDDGYFFDHIDQHFVIANRTEELRDLLLNYDWLLAKLKTVGVNSLISNYESFKGDSVLGLVKSTLRLSAHVLVKAPEQLTERLWGHLAGGEQPEITALLNQSAAKKTIWLRPRQANLDPPDGALIRTLSGHRGRVRSVAVMADGKRVISASEDRTLKLWDLETGSEIRTFSGHTDRVRFVAITPSERCVISASNDNTLKVWDLDSGNEIKTLSGHSDRVRSVIVTNDEKRAISASGDKTIKVWDLKTGCNIQTLTGHSERVSSLALSSDEKQLISASNDSTIKLWDLNTGAEKKTLRGHSSWVNAVVIANDGKRLISASADDTLKIWDLETGQVLHTLEGHTDQVRNVAITNCGKKIISASTDETLKVWDLETGHELKTFTGHSNWIDGIAVTADGKLAVSASHDETLKVWDLKADNQYQNLSQHKGWINDAAISSDGKIAISASSDTTLKIWNLESGKEIATLSGHSDWVQSVAVTADGGRAVSASRDKTLKVWDLTSRKELKTLLGHSYWVESVAITADGDRAVSASSDKTLKVWDLSSGKEIKTLSGHSKSVRSVTITADGNRAVSASADGTWREWNLETGNELKRSCDDSDTTLPLQTALIDNEQAVIITYRDWTYSRVKTFEIWDLGTESVRVMAETPDNRIMSIAVTSDERRMITASWNKNLSVWDLETGKCLAVFQGDCALWACAISPDSKTIVAGGQGGKLHFFDLVDHT